MSNHIEWAVSTAVEFLTPRGSCTVHRWLTFDLRIENAEGDKSFEWLAQYSPTSSYVEWRTVLKDGVPHTCLYDRASWYKPRAPWVPTAELTAEDQPDTKHGETVTAPGFVISCGSHDSCWRDNASRLHGWPRVFSNYYTDQDGKQRENTVETRYWDFVRDTDRIFVKSISVKGQVASAGWGSEETYAKFAAYKDGEWINDTDLEGPWAIFYGMSKLAFVVAEEELILRVDGSFDKGEYGKRGYKERREMVHYRIKDGLVTHKGITEENQFFRKGWEPVAEPYKLDKRRFMLDCGFAEKDMDTWRLRHLFPETR
jgi:hypothetical protein